jgi:tetratricopeptide (TPR) repeat protein
MPKSNRLALAIVCAFAVVGCAGLVKHGAEQSGASATADINHGVTAEAMYRLGRYFQGQRRHDEAIYGFREALKRNPAYVEAHSGLGVSLAATASYEEAIAEFEAAIALSPASAYLHNNLGYAYLLQGSNEQALNALEEARRLDPEHQAAAYNLQLAYKRIAEERTTESAPSEATAAASMLPEDKLTDNEAQTGHQLQPTLALIEVAPSIFELRMPAAPERLEGRRGPDLTRQVQDTTPPMLKHFKLEVSNGNGVTGMARRVAGFLDLRGYSTARLTNQLPFQQAATEVQYRSGYGPEAAILSAVLPKQVSVVESSLLRNDIHVRVVLGSDLRSDAALFESRRRPIQLAETGGE